ncbi:fibronectin type III domain-containing protein [Paenibacillus kobensis]|uniref:fibronectin type III domain-containing protein n=1 Tax=Paenibacillus kobensis TaxID=59841 RepID=UPI000FDA2E63|nr:fibronectin type III domain-containing protein [Paenibacillus kobensis]
MKRNKGIAAIILSMSLLLHPFSQTYASPESSNLEPVQAESLQEPLQELPQQESPQQELQQQELPQQENSQSEPLPIETTSVQEPLQQESSVNNYIVTYKNSGKPSKLDGKLKKKSKARKHKKLDKLNVSVVELDTNEANLLRQDPEISSVELDRQVRLLSQVQATELQGNNVYITGGPNNVELPLDQQTMPWGLMSIGADQTLGYMTGQGIKVAILDTGIAQHSDLNVVEGASFVEGISSFNDDNGHGTNVAGVIQAQNNSYGIVGIAPETEIYAVKVLDSSGNGTYSQVIQGIEWAINNNVNIINMSFGGEEYSAALHDAIVSAVNNNILVVASAGNNGYGSETDLYPAKFEEVLSIGATNEIPHLASFSSVGSQVDLVAPGANILTTGLNNTYMSVSGTSVSAAHATGSIAALWSRTPSMSSNDIKTMLFASATQIGEEFYGWGLINLAKAAGLTNAPLPPVPSASVLGKGSVSTAAPAQEGEVVAQAVMADQTITFSHVISTSSYRKVQIRIFGPDSTTNVAKSDDRIKSTTDLNLTYPAGTVISYDWAVTPDTKPGKYLIQFQFCTKTECNPGSKVSWDQTISPYVTAPASGSYQKLSDTSMRLTWSAATNASKYRVTTNSDSGVTVNSTSYDATVMPGSTYNFRVYSINKDGFESKNATLIYVVVPATQLPAAPQQLATENIKSSEATLKWQAVNGATGYKVKTDAPNSSVVTLTSSTTSYTFKNLTPNTKYNLYVAAVNNNGDSTYSSIAATTAQGLVTPILSVGEVGPFFAQFQWPSVIGAEGYTIKLNGEVMDTVDSSYSEYVLAGLDPSSIYSVGVSAFNAQTSTPYGAINISTLSNPYESGTVMTAGNWVNGSLVNDDDADYYRFTPAATGLYTFDSLGSIYLSASVAVKTGASSYNVIMGVDENDYDSNFQMSMVLNANQTYYICITQINESAANYQFRVTGFAEEGDTISEAKLIGTTEQQASINYPGDVDYYKFIPSATGQYSIESLGAYDVVGSLYNSSGSLLATNDDYNIMASLNFRIDSNLTAGQTYYVQVNHYSAKATGPYSLKITQLVDAQPPSVPGNVRAESKTDSTVTLRWDPSTDNVAVTGYDLYQNGVKAGSTTNSTMTVYSLSPSTAYSFQIRAKDASGNLSGLSTSVAVTTSPDSTKPSAPSNLSVSSKTATGVVLAWSGSSDNVAVTGYDIYQGTTLIQSVASDKRSATVSNLQPSTSYVFTVKARDAAGNLSDASNQATVTTTGEAVPPSVPSGVTFSKTDSSVTLTWTASTDNVGVIGYDIYQGSAIVKSVTGTAATITNLKPSTSYTFTVRAKDAAGNVSAASNAVTVTTNADTTAPSVPVMNTIPTKTETSITLTWTASTDSVGVTGYDVYNGSTLYRSVSATNVTVTGLVPNTTYRFTVKAKDGAGNVSAASTPLDVKTNADTVAPTTPTGLTIVEKANDTITLAWNPSTDNIQLSGYVIYKNSNLDLAGTTSAQTFTMTLTPNTPYNITVKALDIASNLSTASNAVQSTYVPPVKNVFGGTGNDYFRSVDAASDGGFVTVGYSTSKNGDMSSIYRSAGTDADAVVAKYNATGDLEWKRGWGGTGSDIFHSVTYTGGRYVIAGSSSSTNGDMLYYGTGTSDAVFSIWNPDGSIYSKAVLAGSKEDTFMKARISYDGGAYAAVGYSNSPSIPNATGSNKGNYDAIIVQYSPYGGVQWAKSFGGSDDERFVDVVSSGTDGGWVAVGYSRSNDGDMAGLNKGAQDAIIVKFDSSGNVVWKKSYGGSYEELFRSIRNEGPGYFNVTGASFSSDGDLAVPSGNAQDAIYASIDPSGNLVWYKNFGGPSYGEPFNQGLKLNNGYYAGVGSFNQGGGDLQSIRRGGSGWNSDGMIVVFRPITGFPIQVKYGFGGTGSDYFESSALLTSGKIVVAGSSESTDGDMTGSNKGGSDGIILIYDVTTP